MNVELACRVIEKLLQIGVTEVCLCAGGRNSPLVVSLRGYPQIRVWHFFEERSAAFFALGRSWAKAREPIAICTTSGTAAGELLPAMMEAYYSGIPLVAVTADRPRSFRGSGAPQSADQVGLFSHYVKGSFDIATLEEVEAVKLQAEAPLHINVCFSEPLLDGPVRVLNAVTTIDTVRDQQPARPEQLKEALSSIKRPLLILSQLTPQPFLSELVETSRCLIYAEAVSQLRRKHRNLLRAGADKIPALASEGVIDGVIRLGGVPTLRFWRDLEDRFRLPVVSICSPEFSGLARPTSLFGLNTLHLELLCEYLTSCDSSRLAEARAKDAKDVLLLEDLLARYPKSEPGWIRWLSTNVASKSRVFLGNSLPIREWDLAAEYSDKDLAIHASRGLNGIDGQLSTFLGWAGKDAPNIGIFGDLTALYDLAAPSILRQAPDMEIKIVVINNRGGHIFERMYEDSWFLNAHEQDFESWASFWRLDYFRDKAMPASPSRRMVVEIAPDPDETAAFWKDYGG